MAVCDGVRNMWIPLVLVVVLLYGTGLILYIINTASGKSKRTRIRAPLGRDQDDILFSRETPSFAFENQRRDRHKTNDKTITASDDYFFDLNSPEDFLRSASLGHSGENSDYQSSEGNAEENEDSSLDERDFGFLTQGWDKQEGQSCLGFADNDRTIRSFHLSKLMCASNVACHCIECKRDNPNACTLRSATKLVSNTDVDSYTRIDSHRNHGSPRTIVHPGKQNSGKVGPSYQIPKVDTDWKKHEASSCHGFASKHPISRDLEASKVECERNARCYGIECERTWQPNPKDCTLRAHATLASYKGADCYVPQWKKHASTSCSSLLSSDTTVRSLEASKTECFKNNKCLAIQCEKSAPGTDPTRCTLRAYASFITNTEMDCYERVEKPKG